MARKMRIPPSGPFITDETTGAGPLDGGDGTPGLIFRAQGIANAANQLFSGAAQLLEWQNPAVAKGSGPAITVLPWVVTGGYLYDVELYLPVRFVALAAGATVDVVVRARNISTGVLSDQLIKQYTLGDLNFLMGFMVSEPTRLQAAGTNWDQWQVEVTSSLAAADFGVISDQLCMRMTQYAQGSQ